MTTTSLAAAEIDALMLKHPKGFDLSLDRIRRLLTELGEPQRKLPPQIHIAGTNGKGSVTAFCRAILEADGQAVHAHTSPHLVNWHERYRIGRKGEPGALVDDAMLAEAVSRAAKANAGAPITVFEILTAVTFLLFSENPADAVLLEVGLGGRFDATNVIEKPAVTVITSISLDHQSYLGDRVELIAAEKGGIIKRGVPVVLGQQNEAIALEVLTSMADRARAPLLVYGQDFFAYEEHGRLVYQDESGLLDLPMPRLPGRHQLTNAATAIAALRHGGFAPADKAIEAGLSQVEWPGRMQQIASGPLSRAAGRSGGARLAAAVPDRRNDQHQGPDRFLRVLHRHCAACLYRARRLVGCRHRPRRSGRGGDRRRSRRRALRQCRGGDPAGLQQLGRQSRAALPDLRLALSGRRRPLPQRSRPALNSDRR